MSDQKPPVGLSPYLLTVKRTLESLMSVELLESQVVERQMRPELYPFNENKACPEMVCFPVVIAKNNAERVSIAASVNSVLINVAFKKNDELEKWIYTSFSDFIHKRSFDFVVLCKTPQRGYDFSFLIYSDHTNRLLPYKVVDFILEFLQGVDKNMNNLKLAVNARTRNAAEDFLNKFY